MPDRATKISTNPVSGEVNIEMPSGVTKRPTDTHIEVTPGTHEHSIAVSDMPTEQPQEPEPERRRAQTSVVNVQQPPSGGLTGPWATVANMSAVAVLMVFLLWVYRDSQSNLRDFLNVTREERRQDRADSQAANAAMVGALTSLSAKVDAMVLSNQSSASEMRQARQEMTSMIKIIAAALKPPNKIVGPDDGCPEVNIAPMPKAKLSPVRGAS